MEFRGHLNKIHRGGAYVTQQQEAVLPHHEPPGAKVSGSSGYQKRVTRPSRGAEIACVHQLIRLEAGGSVVRAQCSFFDQSCNFLGPGGVDRMARA